MKPAAFDYAAPETLEEVIELLTQHGDDAKVLAGGQSLAPMMNMRLASPLFLVDVNRVAGTSYICEREGNLVVGMTARQREVEKYVSGSCGWSLLAEAMPHIGHVTNRNRGTVCGSIAHADPAAELPAVATLLGATVIVAGAEGERLLSPDELFVSYMMTSLEASEVITEVRFPESSPNTGTSWQELARRHGDYAIAGVGATLALNESGGCESVKIVCIGVSSVPLDASGATSIMVGETPTEELYVQTAEAVAEISEAVDDIHASAAYRTHLVKVLTKRALECAYERARGAFDGI